jgi:hypothetical protein
MTNAIKDPLKHLNRTPKQQAMVNIARARDLLSEIASGAVAADMLQSYIITAKAELQNFEMYMRLDAKCI